ncbi:DUF4260 family protein [Streptomyces axinellae]|uniref:DUF4260 domain-containing protein n=1 Tax=Streptomyces axinellae TaxID=552788 RepID=A0ABP6C261_9ACTN
MNGWTWRSPGGRALSAAVSVAALCAGARAPGPRSRRALWTCALLPDVALLYGIASAPAFDPLPRYAVRPYNALHSPGVPLALLGAARLLGSGELCAAGCGWLAHIGVDRACGYGPRAADGSRR